MWSIKLMGASIDIENSEYYFRFRKERRATYLRHSFLFTIALLQMKSAYKTLSNLIRILQGYYLFFRAQFISVHVPLLVA